MSTVGERLSLKLTENGANVAGAAASTRGSKGRKYFDEVAALVADGMTGTAASEQVAAKYSTSPGNVRNAYQRLKRTADSNGTTAKTTSKRSSTRTVTTPGAVPSDLADILDAIRKDRQALHTHTDELIQWGLKTEAKVADALNNAREVGLRQIREAAASLPS